MNDCIFCKIISGEIPAEKIYEDEHAVVFKDLHPIAPTHLLVVPREHFASLSGIPKEKMEVMAKLYAVVQKVATQVGVAKSGYRTIINTGPDSGQVVFHLHLHVIGGERLGRMG